MILRCVRPALALCALLSLALAGCGDSEGEQLPVNVFGSGGDGGVLGCVQPFFPEDQPDLSLLSPPVFVTDAPNGQAVADPGDLVEAEITVNSATRYALVELRDAWANIPPIATAELDTPGKQILEVLFFTPVNVRPSRFYMRITLCGFDCDEREVIFDMNPDVNSDYERTLIEDGEFVQVDRTCLGFIPRATVLIQ